MIELTSTTKIKLASPSEINDIAQLQIDALEIHQPIQPVKALFVRELEQRWRNQLQQDADILILKENETIIGFAIYTYSETDTQSIAEIKSLYIIPNKRRKYFGQRFCNTVFNEIKKADIKAVVTWLVEENLPARQFYKSLGFLPTEQTRHEIISNGMAIKEIQYQLELLST